MFTVQPTDITTTTTTPIETTTVKSGGKWPSLLVDKLQAVFDENRPGKGRTWLLKKWKKLSDKFIDRYESVAQYCQIDERFEDDSVDFDSINTCKDINRVEASFYAWGKQFTYDCMKEKRDTHNKWLKRVLGHVKRVGVRTRGRLDCY